MEIRRLKLHDMLMEICPNVYFNPPETVKLNYPCIIYNRSNGNTAFADNNPYTFRVNYQITVIDRDPDSEMINKIAALPTCRYDRHYKADKLNHDVFDIYF